MVTKQITGCLEIEGQELGDGNCKRDTRKLLGVADMFTLWMLATVLWLHMSIYQIVRFKCVQFAVYQLHLNKAALFFPRPLVRSIAVQ